MIVHTLEVFSAILIFSSVIFYVIQNDKRYILEHELHKYKKAFEASNVVMIITDEKANVQTVNPEFTLVTQFTEKEAIGQNANIFKSGFHDREFYSKLWNTVNRGETWKGEFLNRKKDGTLYWERTSIAPIKNERNIITNFVAIREDITKQKELAEQLEKLSYTDHLTGIYNRRKAMGDIQEYLTLGIHDSAYKLCVLMIDIDDFKKINDRFGHAAGDEVLKDFSSILKTHIRSEDIASRIGGEEFLIILKDSAPKACLSMAQRIRSTAEKSKINTDSAMISYTVSIGICVSSHENDIEKIIKSADKALYQAKKTGKNRVHLSAEEMGK